MPDEKWLERPLAYVVLKQDGNTSLIEEEFTHWLAARFPKWWLPDRYVFTNEIPKNANGKYNKNLLRQLYSEADDKKLV
jgi:fatty-acyl-CoA synthase